MSPDNKEEMPLGFSFSMAMNEDAMRNYSSMSALERQDVIDRAKNVKSKKEMQNLVDSLAKHEKTF